jgi:hypothetical protein
VHHGRWEERAAGASGRAKQRVPDDVHEGRAEDRAFYGDGGNKGWEFLFHTSTLYISSAYEQVA